jgi:hypothetical protein
VTPKKKLKLKKGRIKTKTCQKKKNFLKNSYHCRSLPMMVGLVVARVQK